MNARWLALTILSSGMVGCAGGEVSIALFFPNEVVKKAIKRLKVEAYNPDTNAASTTERNCNDFLNMARMDRPPLGTPTTGSYTCLETPCPDNWFVDQELKKVQAGKKIIYVLGYARTEDTATPILEGCNDRFDSNGGGDEKNEVPIDLQLVIPDSTSLVKSAGDRQVGRAGEVAAVPLQIKVQADLGKGPYTIPGVPITFTSQDNGFRMVEGENGTSYATYSDENGLAQVNLTLPNEPGTGIVVAEAPALLATGQDGREKTEFSVSVTSPVAFPTKDVLSLGNARPVAGAIAQLIPGGPLELAVVSCVGSEPQCAIGSAARAPFGTTKLTVITDLTGAKTNVPVTSGGQSLGVLPVGLVIGNFDPGAEPELMLANSRRELCQNRTCPLDTSPQKPCACWGTGPGGACPCEGSEVLIFRPSGANEVALADRLTMTGSNAVGIAAVRQGATVPTNVVIAAQGRSHHTRPCSRSNRCLPYLPYDPNTHVGCMPGNEAMECGCPPQEKCDCLEPSCQNNNTGVCVARDKMIDLVSSKTAAQVSHFYNKGGCQSLIISCQNTSMEMQACSCLDQAERGNMCGGRDPGCPCKVPDRIYIGDGDSPVPPLGLAAGAIRDTDDFDLVVPTLGGLDLIESKLSSKTYAWKGEPTVNAPLTAAVIAQLDPEIDEMNDPDAPADVIWYAREKCVDGSNFQDRCPIWRPLPTGETEVGCLGVYFTAGAKSALELRTPEKGGCRRHRLSFQPDGLCVGRFNPDDDYNDVALASRTLGNLLVYSGDGRGGLLDPPEMIPLPGGMGGPLVCKDIDGDGLDDVVVLDLNSGSIQILRTGS